jgi:ssDNA-binding Zn-finger/Zn-ribbon topoisomerase 1
LKDIATKNGIEENFNCIRKRTLDHLIEKIKSGEIKPNCTHYELKYQFFRGYREFLSKKEFKSSHGIYSFEPNLPADKQKVYPDFFKKETQQAKEKTTKLNLSKTIIKTMNSNLPPVVNINENSFIPKIDPSFIKPSVYYSIKNIIQSKLFFPIYIYGESGVGKTTLVEQVCAETNRELFVISITEQTTEEDLVGSMRLENGNTVYRNGPIVQAMKRGAVVLLDEFDLATTKIMCLQRIMEGKPILIKKETEIVYPAPGFNIVAAANTNGKLLDSGRYIGARVQNEAILDRFSAIYKMTYLPEEQEVNMIMNKIFVEFQTIFREMNDEQKQTVEKEIQNFTTNLVKWATNIRKTFEIGAIEDTISSRRLIFIVKYWLLTNCKKKDAIAFCISRFSPEIQESMLKLYEPISGE